jgi:hypothetical protein
MSAQDRSSEHKEGSPEEPLVAWFNHMIILSHYLQKILNWNVFTLENKSGIQFKLKSKIGVYKKFEP